MVFIVHCLVCRGMWVTWLSVLFMYDYQGVSWVSLLVDFSAVGSVCSYCYQGWVTQGWVNAVALERNGCLAYSE